MKQEQPDGRHSQLQESSTSAGDSGRFDGNGVSESRPRSSRAQANVNPKEDDYAGNVFLYIGPPPDYKGCPFGVWSDSGNLLDGILKIDTSQLPGGNFYDTLAHAQSAYGEYTVIGIALVVHGGWSSSQTVWVDNTDINGTTYTYESKDSCTDDGWKVYTDFPGPFSNQGQCVSYFETGK